MPCTTPRFTYFIASSISFILKGIQMAIVGANEWKGGFLQYSSSGLKTGSYEADIETDSYLGKNVQTKQTPFACTANAFFSFLFAIKFYVIYYYGIKSIVLCFMWDLKWKKEAKSNINHVCKNVLWIKNRKTLLSHNTIYIL